jgi:phosphatidate cytidylyltransferase
MEPGFMKKPSNIVTRTLSALILAPLVLLAIYLGGIAFNLTILLCSVLMAVEWGRIVRAAATKTLRPLGKLGWNILGFFYVVIPCGCLIALRDLPQGEQMIVIWMLFTIWAVDTGAYFTGITIGGPKLAPKISPKKTWAGTAGGIIAAVLVGLCFALFGIEIQGNTVANSVIIALLAVVGDLLESAFKRHFMVKDSGNLIPGHGGILDRVDSIVTVAVYVFILQTYI